MHLLEMPPQAGAALLGVVPGTRLLPLGIPGTLGTDLHAALGLLQGTHEMTRMHLQGRMAQPPSGEGKLLPLLGVGPGGRQTPSRPDLDSVLDVPFRSLEPNSMTSHCV